MPLAFESLSHGTIAFGFFNIKSDMLLLDRYFLFASDFCRYVGEIATAPATEHYKGQWEVQFIESSEEIGDLMGAIHGIRFTGFIGELYRLFPFPRDPQDFKQNPEGWRTQAKVMQIIRKYARPIGIEVKVPPGGEDIALGDYRFSRRQFQELLTYVWEGGYPGWQNGIRPAYVLDLKAKIKDSAHRLFDAMCAKRGADGPGPNGCRDGRGSRIGSRPG
ncbi:MAG: hypothetical protein JRJ29_16725 [Deltaproteobacteria bacterium]|nr:hypothetical protein [Deltaproteobacteria bacterium]